MSVTTNELIDLYLAYFGRPPDAGGIAFYSQANVQLSDVIAAFGNSAESQALYGMGSGGSFGAAQVNAIYQNLFNRDAEPAGAAYWEGVVNAGLLSPAGAALAILQGAQGADLQAIHNKETLIQDFLAAITPAENTGYAGATSIGLARAYLHTVDSTPGSLTAAEAVLGTELPIITGQTTSGGGSNPPPPPPPFSASVDDNHIASFISAGAQIGVSLDTGTYTFTSGSATATFTGEIDGFVIPAGSTFTIASALAHNDSFSGPGTSIIVADAGGEDLTTLGASGETAIQLTDGQDYTLTVAEAAVAQIGAAGTRGTLTHTSGSITVVDTLANLTTGGKAAALHTAGADQVVATVAATTDLTATDVSGIDGLQLADNGSDYTLTAAEAAIAQIGANGTPGDLTHTGGGTVTIVDTLATLITGSEAAALHTAGADQVVATVAATTDLTATDLTGIDGLQLADNGSDYTLTAAEAAIAQVDTGGILTLVDDLTHSGGGTITVLDTFAHLDNGAASAITGADNVTAIVDTTTNISADTITGITQVALDGAITLTAAQYGGLTGGITVASGGTAAGNSVTITDTGGVTLTDSASVGSYQLNTTAGVGSFTIAHNANVHVSDVANPIADLFNISLATFTGTLTLNSNNDTVSVRSGADISGATIDGSATHATLSIGGSDALSATISAAQAALFHASSNGIETFSADGSTDATLTIADQGTINIGAPERLLSEVDIQAGSTVNISVGDKSGVIEPGSSDHEFSFDDTVTEIGSTGNTLFTLDNGGVSLTGQGADATSFVTINGFQTQVGESDNLALNLGGNLQSGTEQDINLGTSSNVTVGSPNHVIVLTNVGQSGTALADATDLASQTSNLQTAINLAGSTTGNYGVAMDVTGGAAVYEIHISSHTIDGIQLIGVLNGVSAADLIGHVGATAPA